MAKFEIEGVNYEFVQSPTFGEGRAIENVTGVPFASLADPSKQSVCMLQALVWISMRRVNPEIAFQDLDDIDMGVLADIQDAEPEADPTVEVASTTSTPSD